MKFSDYEITNLQYSAIHVPYNIGVFAFSGASAMKRRVSCRLWQEGKLGAPIESRIPIIAKMHEYLEGRIVGGLRVSTVRALFNALRKFFSHVDFVGADVGLNNLMEVFISWGRELSDRHARKEPMSTTARGTVSCAGVVVAYVCGIASNVLVRSCRFSTPPRRFKRPAKSQYIAKVASYIEDLEDVVDCLSISNISGPLPVCITSKSSDNLFYSYGGVSNFVVSKKRWREESESIDVRDSSVWAFRVHVNLRLICEMMLFINDTSANFEQASKLKFSSRRMTYTENGTKYHAYKDRKGGEVSYSITAGYSGRFKRYLEFRAFLVENNPSDELFPFIRHPRKYRSGNIQDRRLRTLMSLLGRPFVPASVLRTCALNKVLQEGGNIDDVLKLGQHSRRTFFRSYFLPNHQLASKEWSDFFKFVNDRRKAALVFGGCSGESGKKIPIVAGGSPEPDCINPAGCLFCVHYRGEESMDYIWALLSYKKLKCLEYACSKAAALSDSITPLEGLLARIADVESQFIVKAALQESHSEASERILEENYHPYWRGFIELLERQ